MTDTQTDSTERTGGPDTQRTGRVPGEWLRFVPPVAALGTAFVLQVIAMTDTVGTALADSYGRYAYLFAGLLGLAVASCAEGGAAYLMDLYDKHLLEGDSVVILRLSMLVYVGASAGVIHWWLDHRGLPTVISWVLGGMSASAMYLWSRGARWRRRAAMRKQNLIDTALPRFTMQAKLFHPFRWFHTVRLISWEPAKTPAEARARYDAWKHAKAVRKAAAENAAKNKGKGKSADSAPDTEGQSASNGGPDTPPVRQQSAKRTPGAVRPPVPRNNGNVVLLSGRGASIEQLADTLGEFHPGQRVGKDTAQATLKTVYGSCSTSRAISAKDVHNARLLNREPNDSERVRNDVTG